MAKKIPREFVPIDLLLPRDPAIRRAGPMAELLFIRGLIYCKGQVNADGIVPLFDLPVVAAGLKGVQQAAAALVRENLWEKHPDGYRVRSWSKWNMSADEQAHARQRKRVGAAKTNHVKGLHAGDLDPECPYCTGDERPPMPPEPDGERPLERTL